VVRCGSIHRCGVIKNAERGMKFGVNGKEEKEGRKREGGRRVSLTSLCILNPHLSKTTVKKS